MKSTVFWKKFTSISWEHALSFQKANDEDGESRFFQTVDKFLSDYMALNSRKTTIFTANALKKSNVSFST